MGRRRNVKRNLPSMEVVSFEGSSTFSKRRITLTTPDVVQPVEGSGSKDDDLIEEHTMQPLAMDIIDGNEGDDEDDSEDDQAEVSCYKKRQQRAAQGWENIRDAMLRAVIESEWIPDGSLCTECRTANAMFRCLKCGAGVFYCEACVSTVHSINRNVFHLVEQWKASTFVLKCCNIVLYLSKLLKLQVV